MKMTYELAINGPDPALVEQAVRAMDKIVRRWYNVHGGYRASSCKGYGGEYFVYMEYTADWDASALHIWPDWNDLRKAFFRKLWKIDPYDELEVHTRAMPWRHGPCETPILYYER